MRWLHKPYTSLQMPVVAYAFSASEFTVVFIPVIATVSILAMFFGPLLSTLRIHCSLSLQLYSPLLAIVSFLAIEGNLPLLVEFLEGSLNTVKYR